MFPFRFDWNEIDWEHNRIKNEFEFYKFGNNDIEKRVQLQKLHTLLEPSGWRYEQFKIDGKDKHLLYSEYSYFYDYARDSIYNLNDFSETAISNFYRKTDFDGKLFELKIKEKGKEPYITKASTYELEIVGVTLRVFNTGVAIFSMELDNYKYGEFSDILRINDYGRRVYPQFIGEDGIKNTKETFLADSIKIQGTDVKEIFEYQDFSDTQIGEHILDILGQNIFTQNRKEEQKFYIQPSLDDRMFVISWYGNDALSADLQVATEHYSQSDEWYKYLFADNNFATVQNDEMKRELLKNATYDRWSKFKTLFGITRYSFVVLTESKESLQKNNAEFIINHSKTMYFQMITILLATRTSILRFSDEIASLASNESIDTEKLTKLYQRYLTFYNRLYFKEVTHQDQGIELYDMARKQMKIDEHIEKLDGKFTKLFEFAKIQSDDKNSEKMDRLTVMGAIFLPPSLMIALFSMGIFEYEQSVESLGVGIFFIVLSAVLTFGFIKLEEKIKKIGSILLVSIVSVAMIILSLKMIGEKANKVNDVNITNPTINVKIKK
jgi:hypothetical protein